MLVCLCVCVSVCGFFGLLALTVCVRFVACAYAWAGMLLLCVCVLHASVLVYCCRICVVCGT